jgi:2-methylcitrate dehydratase PrpD
VFGNASLGAFERERRDDPRLTAMMGRIKLTADKAQKDDDESIVTVELADRRTFSCRVSDPLGSPTNPVTDEALFRKFLSVSGIVFGEVHSKLLAERLLGIEGIPDMKAALLPLLGAKPAHEGPFSA